MRLTIAAVGRMKAGPERELADRYFDRLKKAGPPLGLDYQGLFEHPESRLATTPERKRDEAQRLAASLPEGAARIVLDETGRLMSSQDFADAIAGFRDGGQRDLGLLIGGPDGHDESLRGSASLVLSLGRMTFPHQIARILLAEQLYRAVTILAGHPYHRS
ncbi:23S rRNA (pseudouridine(1915)-N(3))-methyltransferase RlmH [Aurantimonas endophytica]|uniref:Ribosomal RNA large subunit methyltransferase H n=1 Tax=Aurantimonas endophytica TaxID=1522175 RepID=A0A7W6HE99_9HYPH|nr:23S rRNA (pseudouridine(1915)-N(3))-methyltransferase RlmH [Aurantimonas endophytica]MBB4003502.1 23S rRNA (pseudouridine1915-N3)-methyltransferase [Aurantimonas endophytica]MCO6404361.1 23S rRNA (pseudouridine(1915)-N(3))-methyltransferase RlmH [Aurantimonas endophytica]